MLLALFIAVGFCAGILAGLFGGGLIIIIPALTFITGYSQKAVTGTSLVAFAATNRPGGGLSFLQAKRH